MIGRAVWVECDACGAELTDWYATAKQAREDARRGGCRIVRAGDYCPECGPDGAADRGQA